MNYREKKKLALRVPIADILEHEGICVNMNVCHSPFREDKNASLHIYPRNNRWVDYGTTEGHRGGDGINLVMLLHNLDFKNAVDYILRLSKHPATTECNDSGRVAQRGNNLPDVKHRVDRVTEINHPTLIKYALSRRIPLDVLRAYCKEIHYTYLPTGAHLFGIGIKNDNGGWAVRTASHKEAPGMKLDLIASGMTTIRFSENSATESAYVFEGFFNFLSWVALYGQPDRDIFVLNGIGNVRYLSDTPLYGTETLLVYPDNDPAGQIAFNRLAGVSGSILRDLSDVYRQYNLNDLNDYLIAHPEMTKKPCVRG